MTRKIAPTTFIALLTASFLQAGDVTVIGGGGESEESHVSQASEAKLVQPFSVDFAPDGTLYGVEYEEGGRVFKIDPEGGFAIVAGRLGRPAGKKLGDVAEGDGEPAAGGRFNGMHDLAVHPSGDLYIADTFNNRIRKIDGESGILSTVAGTGEAGFSGDGGPAVEGLLNGPYTVALTPAGDALLIADLGNHRVRRLDLGSGLLSTVAGSGKKGLPEDGVAALESPFVSVRAAAMDPEGRLWIASRNGNALRLVDLDGRVTTVVNPGGKRGYSGDGGPGLAAQLAGPKHLAFDPEGRVIISDDENHAIRRYDPATQEIELLAGMPPEGGDAVGGDVLSVGLNRPHGARYDREGNLYICDSWNGRILRIGGGAK